MLMLPPRGEIDCKLNNFRPPKSLKQIREALQRGDTWNFAGHFFWCMAAERSRKEHVSPYFIFYYYLNEKVNGVNLAR